MGDKTALERRSEAWGLDWCVNKMLLKGEEMKQKLMFSKYELNCKGALRNQCNSNALQTGVWGRGLQLPEAMGDYLRNFVIFWKE